MRLFLSPHNDDETLFGAFTIMRERPQVIVVYDSYLQVSRGSSYCDWRTRRGETLTAMNALWQSSVPQFCALRDDTEYGVRELAEAIKKTIHEPIDVIFAPAWERDGHDQHNIVSLAADHLGAARIVHYTTYTRTGGKTRTDNPVNVADPVWIERKLRAMACYKSQIHLENCRDHFMRDLKEYTIEA